MRTLIFKSEKKAKVFEVISSIDQGVYKKNELIHKVKTDRIDLYLNDGQYQVFAKEVD